MSCEQGFEEPNRKVLRRCLTSDPQTPTGKRGPGKTWGEESFLTPGLDPAYRPGPGVSSFPHSSDSNFMFRANIDLNCYNPHTPWYSSFNPCHTQPGSSSLPASDFRAERLGDNRESPGSHGWVQKEVHPHTVSSLSPQSFPSCLPSCCSSGKPLVSPGLWEREGVEQFKVSFWNHCQMQVQIPAPQSSNCKLGGRT